MFDNAAPRVGAGVGVSWKTPFGLINIDLAEPVVKQQVRPDPGLPLWLRNEVLACASSIVCSALAAGRAVSPLVGRWRSRTPATSSRRGAPAAAPRGAQPAPRAAAAAPGAAPAPAPPLLAPPAAPLPPAAGSPSRSRRRCNVQLAAGARPAAAAKGAAPPAAVIGVLGVPEIMRASTAAQQVEKMIGERREKLNEDAQKEQAAWRDMQQALANQRAAQRPTRSAPRSASCRSGSPTRRRPSATATASSRKRRSTALAQIERMLIAVIRQVAESRGMNLVLHRAQVALNVNEFDITEQVAEQLNKVLPDRAIPPDGCRRPCPARCSRRRRPPPAAATAGRPPRRPAPPRPRQPAPAAAPPAQPQVRDAAASPAPATPRFFARTGPHPLAAVAAAAGGDGAPAPRPADAARRRAAADSPGRTQVSFLDNRRYADAAGARPGPGR